MSAAVPWTPCRLEAQRLEPKWLRWRNGHSFAPMLRHNRRGQVCRTLWHFKCAGGSGGICTRGSHSRSLQATISAPLAAQPARSSARSCEPSPAQDRTAASAGRLQFLRGWGGIDRPIRGECLHRSPPAGPTPQRRRAWWRTTCPQQDWTVHSRIERNQVAGGTTQHVWAGLL